MANQIIEESLKQNQASIHKAKHRNKKFHIEFSNEIAEIPYGENLTISKLTKNKKYQLQFSVSSTAAVVFLLFLLWKVYQYQQKEKMSQKLLDNYQLTTLYSDSSHYEANQLGADVLIRKLDLIIPFFLKAMMNYLGFLYVALTALCLTKQETYALQVIIILMIAFLED